MTIQRHFIFIGMTLLILAGVLYGHTLQAPFHQDDEYVLVYNAAVKDLAHPGAIFQEFNTRFLVGLSLAANYALGNLEISGYRLFNITLHAVNAFLIFYLCFLFVQFPSSFKKDSSKGMFLSWFVSLSFLVHPLQTQAVNIIWQRSALMCAFFMLAACICYTRYLKTKEFSDFAVCLLASFAAFFCREVAVTLPFLLFSIDRCFSQPNEKPSRQRWIILIANVFFVFVIAALFVRPDRGASEFFISPNMAASSDIPLWEKLFRWAPGAELSHSTFIMNQMIVFWRYVSLLFVPLGQNVDHAVTLRDSVFDPVAIMSLLGIGVLIGLIYTYGRSHRIFLFGSLWFGATLFLMMLLPSQEMMTEHWLYIPSFGFYLSIGYLFATVIQKPRLRWILLVLILGAWSVLTWQRNDLWNSQVKLWEDAAQKSPGKSRPYDNLTTAYIGEGRYDEALQSGLKAMQINPHHFEAYNNLAIIYMAQNRHHEAYTVLQNGLTLKPDNVILKVNLATLYMAQKKWEEAEQVLLEVLSRHGYPHVYLNLGSIYKEQKRFKDARGVFSKASKMFPLSADTYYDWIDVLLEEKDHEGSKDIVRSFDMKKFSADDLSRIGSLFAKHQQNGAALDLYEAALRMDRRHVTTYLEAGKLLANTGHYQEALMLWVDGKQFTDDDQEFDVLIEELKRIIQTNN